MKKIFAGIVFGFFLTMVGAQAANAVSVKGYFKSNGTYVQPYNRTSPNKSLFDNYSTKGNVNPYTGNYGTVNPYKLPSYSSPSYKIPSYSAPSYTAPSYSIPSYKAPSYSIPSYKAPSYYTPKYTAPSYSYTPYDYNY